MNIQSITYGNAEETSLRVVTGRGEITVPWPCRTWHREPIEAWLADGNSIAAHVPPADPTPAPSVADELLRILTEKGLVEPADFPAAMRARVDQLRKR